MIGTRLAGTLTGPAASGLAARSGGKIAAKIGGEAVGEIIGVIVIAWDVFDHYRTKQTELPILRRDIADYLEQVKRSLRHQPGTRAIRKDHVKTIETIVAVISWIVLCLFIYALSPLLIKLINLGQGLHDMFR